MTGKTNGISTAKDEGICFLSLSQQFGAVCLQCSTIIRAFDIVITKLPIVVTIFRSAHIDHVTSCGAHTCAHGSRSLGPDEGHLAVGLQPPEAHGVVLILGVHHLHILLPVKTVDGASPLIVVLQASVRG